MMLPGEVERLVESILHENSGGKSCCKDGICSDGLCVIHNREGVRTIVHTGAARVSAGMGTEAAGGIETQLAMVVNVGMLKPGEYDYVENDIWGVVTTARRYRALTKVILETSLLTDEEKIKACILAKRAGADFVKTSTGFAKGGATVGDIA